MPLVVSAVVCTRNRAAYLAGALASLERQSLPKSEFEIIVVDNASTDDTTGVIAAARAGLPALRALSEPTVGCSRARNAGLRAARGAYVAYLDDDAIAAPDWLANIVSAFRRGQPEPGCAGGPCVPLWEIPPPPWVTDDMGFALGLLDVSDSPFAFSDGPLLIAANIAYPRLLLEEIGGFPTELGRREANLLSSEECHVWTEIAKRGHHGWYDPSIRVQHRVPAARMTPRYLIRRHYWQGISDAVSEALQHPRGRWSRRLAGLRDIGGLLLPRRLTKLLLPAATPRRISSRCHYAHRLGRGLARTGLVR